jgi:hypothetical protein
MGRGKFKEERERGKREVKVDKGKRAWEREEGYG